MACSLKKEWEDFTVYAGQITDIENSSFPVPWSLNAFEEEVKNSISNLWAVIVDKKLVAYICFWMFDEEIHLLNIAVHPEYRNKGFGKYLIEHLIEVGSEEGISHIWLEVRPSNIPALQMYRQFGFSGVGCRKSYYSDSGEDAIIMELNLKEKISASDPGS